MPRIWVTGEAGAGRWEQVATGSVAARSAVVVDDDTSRSVTVRARPRATIVIDNSPEVRAARMAARRARKLEIAATYGASRKPVPIDTSKSGPVGSLKVRAAPIKPGTGWGIGGGGVYVPPGFKPPGTPGGGSPGVGGSRGVVGHTFDVTRGVTTRAVALGIGITAAGLLGKDTPYGAGSYRFDPMTPPAPPTPDPWTPGQLPFSGIGVPQPNGRDAGGSVPSMQFGGSGDDVETLSQIYFDEITARRKARVWTVQNVRAAIALRDMGRAGLAIVAPRISERRMAVVSALLADPEAQAILAQPNILRIVPSQAKGSRPRRASTGRYYSGSRTSRSSYNRQYRGGGNRFGGYNRYRR